jgi:hypothetical protein
MWERKLSLEETKRSDVVGLASSCCSEPRHTTRSEARYVRHASGYFTINADYLTMANSRRGCLQN